MMAVISTIVRMVAGNHSVSHQLVMHRDSSDWGPRVHIAPQDSYGEMSTEPVWMSRVSSGSALYSLRVSILQEYLTGHVETGLKEVG